MNSTKVIKGRGAPTGTRTEFNTSPRAPTIPPQTGPNADAVKNTVINLSGILIAFPSLIVQKTAKITVSAVSRPKIHNSRRLIFLNPKKFFIIKNPFCGLQKGDSIFSFCNGMRS